MIESIRLLNWRSHADTTLEFREGTNLLVGAMGSGKSSVMDGISFALFGTFPALERRKLKLPDLFRMNEDKASVSLGFGWMGSKYRIERRLIKGKAKVDSEAEIFKDGKMQDCGPAAVTEYIEHLLAVDYGLFTRAIYSEQNNIDYFLTLDPRGRKQELDQLLGLDKFEAARTNIVSVINRIKSNRKVLEEKFDPKALAQIETQIEGHEKELQVITEKQTKGLLLLQAQAKSLKDAESGFSDMKKKKEQHDILFKEKISLEATVNQLRFDIAGKMADKFAYEKAKAGLLDLQKKHQDLVKSAKETDALLTSLSREAGSLESRLKRIIQGEKELEQNKMQAQNLLAGKTPGQLESEKSELEKEAISLFSEQKSLIASISESEELLKNLKPGLSSCPLCDSSLGEHGIEKIAQTKRKKILEQKGRIEELKKAVDEKKKQFSGLSQRLKKVDNLLSSISALSKEVEAKKDTEDKLSEILEKSKIGSLRKEDSGKAMAELEQSVRSLTLEMRDMEQLIRKQEQLGEAGKKHANTVRLLAELAFDEPLFEFQRKNLEECRIILERTSGEKESLEKQSSMLSQMLGGQKKELERLDSLKKDIGRYGKLEEELSIYKNALLETQTSLRFGLTDAINSAMKEIWSIFYPYRNYPSIRLCATDKDYLFEVLEREHWKPLESIASGGERACAALTLRVALAMVLTPNLSWLILDEPTHNLDAEAVSLLCETLQTRVPEVVKQTFVITHEEGLMGADFSMSYKLVRDKAESGPTKVETA